MKLKKTILFSIALLSIIILYFLNREMGLLYIQFGKPIAEKYVYTLRKSNFIDVKCSHTMHGAKLLALNIKEGKADSTDYDKNFFFFSSIKTKVDVYKYLEIDGIIFALIGFDKHDPRMAKRGGGFVPAYYLYDTIPQN